MLEPQEEALKQSLHPDVRAIVSTKKILLFKEMLEAINYDDLDVVDLLMNGVRVTGELPRLGIWEPDSTKAPKMSKQSLAPTIAAAQEKVLQPDLEGRWDEDDKELWEETQKEETAGSLIGPLSRQELEK